MKIQNLLTICLLLVLCHSCNKPAPANTKKGVEKDTKAKFEQLDKELSQVKEEIKRLEEKNEELTQRLIAKEAESSTLAKLMELGTKTYKSGSDRAACILNIRNIHQAIRAHQNLNGFNIGDTIKWNDIFGADNYLEVKPRCPHGGDYILVKEFPQIGVPAARCAHDAKLKHRPESTKGW